MQDHELGLEYGSQFDSLMCASQRKVIYIHSCTKHIIVFSKLTDVWVIFNQRLWETTIPASQSDTNDRNNDSRLIKQHFF